MPIEPPPTPWEFPPVETADEHGVIGVGADLEPGTLIAAYRQGIFPTPVDPNGPVVWWSPDPRGIIPLDGLRVSRSLRKSCRRFDVRIDTAFGEVIDACSEADRGSTWIRSDIRAAYRRLHELGWAHSVEVFTAGDELAGGLYGVAIGGLFAGESMFYRARDASKVALVGLVELLHEGGAVLLDVQWTTPHLESLGAVEIPRAQYLRRLAAAVAAPSPPTFER